MIRTNHHTLIHARDRATNPRSGSARHADTNQEIAAQRHDQSKLRGMADAGGGLVCTGADHMGALIAADLAAGPDPDAC